MSHARMRSCYSSVVSRDDLHLSLMLCQMLVSNGVRATWVIEGRPNYVSRYYNGRLFAVGISYDSVSYTHLRAHETRHDLVCRLLLEKKLRQIV